MTIRRDRGAGGRVSPGRGAVLELRRLRLLHELHRRGTVSAVAEALSYSASTVSQQLGVLQREAGTKLFEPAGRRVRLTDAGLVLVSHAERLLAEAERAEAELAAAAGAVIGTVRIGAFQTASLYLGVPAMTALRREHPQLQVELVEAQAAESALAALRSYQLDLVLAEEYPGARRPPAAGIDREDLRVEPVLLLLPPDHPRAREPGPVPLAALAGEDWVATHPGGGQEVYLRHVCTTYGGFEPNIRHRSDELTLLMALVGAGHALTLLPEFALVGGFAEVAARTIAEAELSRTVYTAVRASAAERPAIAAVRAALREVASRPDSPTSGFA